LPGNHSTFWDGGKFGPDQITVGDVSRVLASGKFFARKFSLDPCCPARQELLRRLRSHMPATDPVDAPWQVSDA
jgi:hypothetical protein